MSDSYTELVQRLRNLSRVLANDGWGSMPGHLAAAADAIEHLSTENENQRLTLDADLMYQRRLEAALGGLECAAIEVEPVDGWRRFVAGDVRPSVGGSVSTETEKP